MGDAREGRGRFALTPAQEAAVRRIVREELEAAQVRQLPGGRLDAAGILDLFRKDGAP
jgi:uncharacterized membrane protein (DUF441 family)